MKQRNKFLKFLAWALPVVIIPVLMWGVSVESRFSAQAAQETGTQRTLSEIKAAVFRIESLLMGEE